MKASGVSESTRRMHQFKHIGLVHHYYATLLAAEREWDSGKLSMGDYVNARRAGRVAERYCRRLNGNIPPEIDSFAGQALCASFNLPLNAW